MRDGKWRFTAQRGYFSHDSDPASWEFRAKTLPNLGLVEKLYPLDDSKVEWSREELARTHWSRFLSYVDFLNDCDPMRKGYKVLFVVRHGQGVHNVKEAEVGREEWNRYWAKIPGDDNSTWLDASLTSTGEQQATEIASLWTEHNIAPPQAIYTSPLRRCLQTTTLGFAPLINRNSSTPSVFKAIRRERVRYAPPLDLDDPIKPEIEEDLHKHVRSSPILDLESPITPVIKENLRERLGVHTCDQRSSKSWITDNYPNFTIEANFTEEDELWKAEYRETIDGHVVRSQEVLRDIFENDQSQVVALVGHSGMSMAIFGAVGWPKVPMAAGAVYPLLVCGERLEEDEEPEEGWDGEE